MIEACRWTSGEPSLAQLRGIQLHVGGLDQHFVDERPEEVFEKAVAMKGEELADDLRPQRRAAEKLWQLVFRKVRRAREAGGGIVLVAPISTFTANAKRSTAFMLYAK